MKIRKFEATDLENVLKLFYETVHTIGAKYYKQDQVKAWAPETLDREHWLNSLTNNITYVAIMDDQLVGFGDLTHAGEVDRLYVAKNYQGKGIALALSGSATFFAFFANT